MKNAKYKILALIDLKASSYQTLKNAVNLAKLLNGNVDVFHAKNITNIVGTENQNSVIRSLNEEHYATNKKIQNTVAKVFKEEGVSISHSFSFGNVKNEILQHINKTKPDIIVVGKRKPRVLSLLGDSVTQLLLNNYFGAILITEEHKKLTLNKGMSLGFYSNSLQDCHTKITKDLCEKASNPIKFFKVKKRVLSTLANNTSENKSLSFCEKSVVTYEFEESVDAFIKFVSKNNIELLCIAKTNQNQGWSQKLMGKTLEINKEINNINVPLLVYNSNKVLN